MSPPKMLDVVAAITDRTGTTLIELQSASRHRHLTRLRQVTIYLLRRLTRASLTMIGRLLYRDHTTILHALSRVEAVMQAEPSLAQLVDEVMALYPPIEIVEEIDDMDLVPQLRARIAALEERIAALEERQVVEGMPSALSAPLPSPPAPPPPPLPPDPPPPPPTRPRPTPFVHRPRPTPAEAMERARQNLEQSLYSPRERAARIAFDHAAKALAAQQTGA